MGWRLQLNHLGTFSQDQLYVVRSEEPVNVASDFSTICDTLPGA